ncbi:MAG: type VI secretion system tip protein VgrG, partial [Chitinophagaceae bacterium]|nr:type VI secretion system tip protein VgrG [Polaromonas sp.]
MTSIDKNLPLANRRFSFTSNKFADNAFAVVNMTGVEMLSTTFRFEVILACDADDIDFKKILTSLVTLTIFAPGATQGAAYKGMLQQFDQLQKAGGVVFYRAVLVPRVARLARYRTSDVYLDSQTVPQILVALLESSGFSALDYEVKTRAIYRTRDLVCQYQETNLDFVNRWTEKEGLYYYFDHSGEVEKMVFVDDNTLLPGSILSVNYRPVDTQSSISSYDAVQNFVCRQRPLPKQVILQDFNYMLAKVPLVQASTVDLLGEGDVMLYGENFLTPDEGKRYADIRAQELVCGGTVFVGDATAVGLRSGYFMHIPWHYRDSYKGDYLVTRVNHAGSQAGMLLSGIQSPYAAQGGETSYTCTFEAIPRAIQFRSERRTPRPHVGGTVSAVIDASGDGQYAEIDSLGRYKVQMPFVKPGRPAGKGSAYIRMATPYSGSGHG